MMFVIDDTVKFFGFFRWNWMSLKHAVRPTLRLEHSWSCWQILQIFHYQQTWEQATECLGLNHTWCSYGMRCFLSSIHEDTKIPMRRWLCILFEVTDNYNFHCLVSVFSKNVIKFKSPEQIHVSQSETTVEPSFGSTKVGCNANYIVLLTAAPTSFAKKYCFPLEDDQNILILTEFFKFLAISIITWHIGKLVKNYQQKMLTENSTPFVWIFYLTPRISCVWTLVSVTFVYTPWLLGSHWNSPLYSQL